MGQINRENMKQSKREIVEGAKQLRAELEAHGPGSEVPCRGDSVMMCEAILEYFAAEDAIDAAGDAS
jgi:hypothetical protein